MSVSVLRNCCLGFLCCNVVVVRLGLLAPLRRLAGKIVFEMTCNVLSWTLNLTIDTYSFTQNSPVSACHSVA